MGSSAELTLGRPCHAVSHGAFAGGHVERILKLEQYLKSLEDERKKIEAFKRELPLCMQLLNDEIEASKEQLADYQQPSLNGQAILNSISEEDPSVKSTDLLPVLEEFIPLRKPATVSSLEEDSEVKECMALKHPIGTKSNGVIQTKFWSQAEAYARGQEMLSSMTDKPYKKRDSMRMGGGDIEVAKPKPILHSQKRAGGAFLPFSGGRKPAELPEVLPRFGNGEASACADMARSSSASEGADHRPSKETQNAAVAAPTAAASNNSMGQATQRKPRRCWSPELHRRFVNALQQLGGSEVATPKQIRELMKIDGLTNDEVKSHLQKYRLHTRRPNPSFHSPASNAPQLVVLGGIWVPPEYAAHAAAYVSQAPPQHNPAEQQASHLQSTPYSAVTHSQGSSQGPLHLTAHSSDANREDSLGEDGNEGTSWKDGYQEERFHEENGDSYDGANVHVHKWRYAHESGEDDSEAEEGRVYETPI